jgi:hypothetical protein
MAVSQIATPSPGASDWSDFTTQVEKQRKGFIAVSLTNFATTSVPQVAAGSVLEIGGSIYQVTSAETINGSVTSSSTNYILFDSSTPEFQWTTTAPTWSDDKQGYYDAGEAKRYVGGCYYDGSDYTDKFVYGNNHKRRQSGEKIEYLSTTADFGESTVTGYALVDWAGTLYDENDSDYNHGWSYSDAGIPLGATVTGIRVGWDDTGDGGMAITYDVYEREGSDGGTWNNVYNPSTDNFPTPGDYGEEDLTFDTPVTVVWDTQLRVNMGFGSSSGGTNEGRLRALAFIYTMPRFAY